MDYYDLRWYILCMKRPVSKAGHYPERFAEELWNECERSVELTPIYVQRYNGLRSYLDETSHDFWEIICVRHGEGYLASGGNRTDVAGDSVCLVPPGVPHSEHSDNRVDLIWVGLRGSLLERGRPATLTSVVSRVLAERIEALWLFSERRSTGTGVELDGMVRRLLGQFDRLRTGSGGGGQEGDVIDKAIRHIHEYAANPLSMADVAKSVGCSEGYFYRLFKKRTGRTPVELLTEIRMQRAARLLRESAMQVGEVARQVGYDDPFYFSRLFRKRMGVSPSRFS